MNNEMENLSRQFEMLPRYLSSHLTVTVVPLLCGIALTLPLAILIVRRERLRYPVLTAAGIVQTVPGLALLALMVPILAWASALSARATGVGFSPLGFLPTVIALTLYSMLPMLRNTVIGIVGVDRAMVEAARGVGMTDRQILLRVELPLAAPVILAGVRTATVWVVGTATLATPVGQTSLGDYIFTGLATQNWLAVTFGCVAAAALAVLLDTLIGALERATAERRRGLAIAAGLGLAVVVAGGVLPPALSLARNGGRSDELAIGAKTFTEQFILSSLIQRVLAEDGLPARRVGNLQSSIGFDALRNDQIDIYVDYSGTIWSNYMKREGTADRETVLRETTEWLEREHGVRVLGPLGFENAYALAMRRDQAERLGIASIEDLARHAGRLTFGADYEWYDRPEWYALQEVYGLHFGDETMYNPTLMYEAIALDQADVIPAYTTDGRIDTYDLVLLADPEQAIPPYDAMLLLSPRAGRRPDVVAALEPLVGSIDDEAMRSANGLVDRTEGKRSPAAAARALLDRLRGRGVPAPADRP